MLHDLPPATPDATPAPDHGSVGHIANLRRALSSDADSVSTVTGVLTGVLSVLTLVPGIILIAAASPAGSQPGHAAPMGAVGVLLLVLALAGLAASFGLLRRTGWAWPAAVVVCGLQVIIALLRFAVGEPAAGPALALVMSSFVVYYLFRLEVRAVYGRD